MKIPKPEALPPTTTFSFKVLTVDDTGSVISKNRKNAEYRREKLASNVALDLVAIPQGAFMMGSPETEIGQQWYQVWNQALEGVEIERPQHKVKISAFFMGRYPVTQAQWRAVAALPAVDRVLDPDPSSFKADRRPVEQVSWDDAIEFCKRLTQHTGRQYRLPSEAEWEYACRAGTTTPFHFGSTITPALANYSPLEGEHNGCKWSGTYAKGPKGEARQQTTEVGSFPANTFGLSDMHGNVWEWCLDHWHQTYQDAPTDGSAWESADITASRILRGGSWFFFPDLCRSAFRNRRPRDTQFDRIGFRVACAIG